MSNWTFDQKWAAWSKAAQLSWFADERVDCDGRIIRWDEYGCDTAFGWHVDHIVPVALGGSDDVENLRARHYRGNCIAGALLGNAMRDNRGIGALTPPMNAMMGGLGLLNDPPRNALLDFWNSDKTR